MSYARTIARINAAISKEIADYGISGTLKIYADSGSIPLQDAALPGTAVLLVTIPFGNPAFGTPSAGSANLTGTPNATAVATGTAKYARVFDTAGPVVISQLNCAVSASDLNFAGGTTITSGGVVTISSGTLSASL